MDFLKQFDAGFRFEQNYARNLQTRLPAEFAVEPRGLRVPLAREKRLLITGAPGRGKTTALAFLARTRARQLTATPTQSRFPIFLSARERSLPRSEALIAELGAPSAYLEPILASDRILILVDDLDSVSESERAAWLDQFAGAQIVATARAALAGFTEFALPGFRDNDIDEFAGKRLDVKKTAFLAALKTSGVPRSLTASPMTLSLLARVFETTPTLPTLRAALFTASANITLRDAAETALMLEGVALATLRGHPASDEFLPKARGFLRAGKNHTAVFTHDLWQSYFAARALRHAPNDEPLLQHLTDPNWFDTILFYAGLGDSQALMDALLARGEHALAGFVVAHAKQVRDESRQAVTTTLMDRAWSGDARAVAALSEMHSETAVDQFAARLKDKDVAVRTRAVELLGQLQLDRGIEYLLPQLRDANRDVRDQVVGALGKSRTDRVVEPLLVALRGDARVGTVDTRMRIAAARALGEIATEKAFTALLVDLQIGEPEVREVVAESLQRIQTPLMSKPLRAILQTGDPLARQYAEQVLAVVDGFNTT